MRIVQNGVEVTHTCVKCKSVIAMFPHELIGQYPLDLDEGPPTAWHWNCPVCHVKNEVKTDSHDGSCDY